LNDNGGFVIHPGVDQRFVGVRDCRHRDRCFPLHQPGGDVRTVATEIGQCSRTVAHRIGEPGQKLWAAADLHRTLMACVKCYFPDLPDSFLVTGNSVRFGIAAIPGGFIIGEQMNIVFAGQGIHSQDMFPADGQWLLHHHMDAPRCTRFHHLQVSVDIVVCHHRLRVRMAEHLTEGRVDQFSVEPVLPGILSHQGRVGLGNTYDQDITLLFAPQQTVDMIMRQSHNAYPYRLLLCRGNEGYDECGQNNSYFFH